jgi:uncharacterized membrane protein
MPTPTPTRPTYGTARLGALSDGVFAIVLTLLVLDLQVPRRTGSFTDRRLIADLAQQFPTLSPG